MRIFHQITNQTAPALHSHTVRVQPANQSGTLDAGSILAAGGDGTGSLLFNADMMLSEGSTNLMQILSDSLYDVVQGSGANTLTVLGDFVFDFTGNTSVTNGSTFAVLQNWDSISISGSTFTTIGLDAALSVDTSDLVATGSVMVVPEPTAISLICLGGFMTLLTCRLCRRSHAY